MAKGKVEAAVLAAVQDQLRQGETVEAVTVAFKDAPSLAPIPILALTGSL
jgi:hypothetical protein